METDASKTMTCLECGATAVYEAPPAYYRLTHEASCIFTKNFGRRAVKTEG